MEDKIICAYCGREITLSDYRVYCPSCKADYHKDCWLANEGCVTEGCEYNRRPAGMCPYCHTPTRREYAYCKKCGRPTNPLMNLVYYPEGSDFYVPDSEAGCAEKLVGEKSNDYMKSFYEMEKAKFKLSWNTPAFLLNGFWFIYRRMYSQGMAILLALSFLVASITFFPGMRILSIPLLIILWAGCGVCANGIYMEHIRKVAREALKVPENHRLDYIKKNGGTDKKFAVIAGGVCAVLFVIFVLVAKAVI